MNSMSAVFERDRFLLRQKHLSITEKYYVTDEEGRQLLFVERPRHLGRNSLAALAGVFAVLVSVFPLWVAGSLVCGIFTGDLSDNGALMFLLLVLTVVAASVLYMAVYYALSVKRHMTFFKDDRKLEKVMGIVQEEKFAFPNAHYTVTDADEQPLARVQKNYLYDLFRKQWRCFRPDGQLMCLIREDQLILALLRRVLGSFYGILRTNFVILEASAGQRKLGEFNRKFTILDRYVLDMSADSMRQIDRRIALAIGVLLDTGERR